MSQPKSKTNMDEASELFLWDLIDDAREEIVKKFEKGQKEHGGFILDMGLMGLRQARREEILDLIVYDYAEQKLMEFLLADPVIKARIGNLLAKQANGGGLGY